MFNKQNTVISIFFSALFFITPPVFSSPCDIKPGFVDCKNETIASMSANGMVSAVHTRILKKLTVNGVLNADHISANQLTINGDAKITNSTISGEFILRGSLSVSGSQIMKTLNLYGNHADFAQSTIQNIHVFKNRNSKQVITLDKSSHIKGDVIFDGGQGLIIAEKGTVIDGKVIGAEVTYK